jgi:Lon-like protease
VVAIAMLIAAGAIYRPPLVVFEPGTTLDVSEDITITGVPSERPEGSYLLTSVRLAQPNVLGLAWAAASGREVAQLSQLLPEGTDARAYFRQQRQIFDQSQLAAAAAAARSAGFEVAIKGTGVIVQQVLPQSPAAEVLQESDVIVGIDGGPVRSFVDLQTPIRARPPGASFELQIERGELERSVQVRSARLPEAGETITGIGVLITTRDFDVELPFEIAFAERRIGGPSAGLAYALAIADMLEPGDLTEGREVGATGTIDLNGAVGSVGGLPAKAEALERAGADLFLVPEAEITSVDETGLEIRGVSSLEQAVESLTT